MKLANLHSCNLSAIVCLGFLLGLAQAPVLGEDAAALTADGTGVVEAPAAQPDVKAWIVTGKQ